MERFIVGTGRCGSTLLTRMLAQHPAVLPLNEFFTGLDWGKRFAPDPLSGADLAALIATPNDVVTQVTARGYDAEEVTYPFEATSRYRRDQGVPWVLVATLPRLSHTPDALFDETMAYARGLPPAPLAIQYRRLFDWLTARFDRRLWIERSGSSIDYVGDLARLYPNARFVHIHRDGHEAALSMRAHPFYRLAVNMLYALVPEAHGGEDPITALLESLPPVEIFGRYWSEQLTRGLAALRRLDPARHLAVRFEDLLTAPGDVLTTIGAFFELPGEPQWTDHAAALVRGAPAPRFEQLENEEQERLAQACREGQRLLGRATQP